MKVVNDYIVKLKMEAKGNWYKVPNILTLSRLFGGIIWGVIFLVGPKESFLFRIIMIGAFAIIAFTDCLDGLTARLFNLRSEFGRLLDPIADTIFVFATIIPLCILNPNAWLLTIVLALRQFFLILLIRLSHEHGLVEEVVWTGKAKTVLASISSIGLMLPLDIFNQYYFIVKWVIFAAIVFSALSLAEYSIRYRISKNHCGEGG